LSIEEIAGGIPNRQPAHYQASFSRAAGPERNDVPSGQSDASKSEESMLRRHEAPSSLSWNQEVLNE
jgi:hypothetical protein